MIPHTYSEKLPYKYHQGKDIRQTQQSIVDQIREVLLKISMFSGLPKSINSLLILKSVTPTALTNSNTDTNISLPKRKNIVEPIEENTTTIHKMSLIQLVGKYQTGLLLWIKLLLI